MARRRTLSDTGIARALDPAIGLARWQRFQARLLGYLLAFSCLTSGVTGGIYYSRQVKFVEAEQATRGNTLISNLAGQSELGAYSSDSAFLLAPVHRAFIEKDVSFAAIYNRQGELLMVRHKQDVQAPLKLDEQTLNRVLADTSSGPLRRTHEQYEDLLAPIISVQADSEEGLFGAAGITNRPSTIGVARLGLSRRPAQQKLDEVLRWGIYLALIVLALGGLLALVLAHRISQPILALARGADEVRRGNLGYQLHLNRADELGLLAESFNRMSSKLKRTVDSLGHLNRNLEQEVAHRTLALRRSRDFIALLNAPLQLDKLLDTALEALVRDMEARAGGVFLQQAGGELELKVVRGASEGALQALAAAEGGYRLQRAARARQPQVVTDLAQDSLLLEEQPGVGALAWVPVQSRGELEAVVLLGLDAPLDQEQLEFLHHASSQLAIAVSNARSYLAVERLARELEHRNIALLQQRDQLQELNRLKSEFVANISHELRTPLNAIIGFTELLAEGVYGETNLEQRQSLDSIAENAANLQLLIDQILDLSKVEAGKMTVELAEVDLNALVQEALERAAPLVKDRPYSIGCELPQTAPVITTDAAKVRQILLNLLSNAIKFTPEGSVTVRVQRSRGSDVTICVADTGIGIRPEHLQVIFDEFRQVDGSSTRVHGGSGLGLAISKKFATLLGGDIQLESTYGEGSCFTLHLPRVSRIAPALTDSASGETYGS